MIYMYCLCVIMYANKDDDDDDYYHVIDMFYLSRVSQCEEKAVAQQIK